MTHIWHSGREYVTHWMVAGLIVAATGVAPDHWMAHLVHELHIPADVLHLWAAGIDLRWVLLGAGLTLVVGDIALRRARPAAVPLMAADRIAGGPSLPDKPSIAVLPFANLSADPEREYFSDGIAEDIITELSRSPLLFVIARNSSFTYKGRPVDVKQVARELGVRYVLEGSVRRDGDRVRIGAQLIDAGIGNHIWAERYDRKLTDMFAVQDEITLAVAIAIAPAIGEAERQRAVRKPTANLNAWEAYHLGLWHASRGGKDDIDLGLKLLRRAVTLDPLFADAHAMLARYYLGQATSGAIPFHEGLALSESEARAALRLDAANAHAHSELAWVLHNHGDSASALEQAERAIAFNPNNPAGYLAKGHILVFTRRPVEARAALNTTLRLDPLGANVPLAQLQLVISSYLERDYVSAEAGARRLIIAYPDYPRPYPYLAATLGHLGKEAEAGVALRQAMSVGPEYFNFLVRARPPWHRPDDYEHVLEGLRKAGWQG